MEILHRSEQQRGAGSDRGGLYSLVKARLDWSTDGAAWPNRAASQHVRSGGLSWHVQIAGTGPAVLLLHGTGASTHSWRDVLPLLAQQRTVIAIDLPGHGFTDLPDRHGLGLEGMSASIIQLLHDLGVQPRAGIGHSAGAAILARMSLDGAASFDRIVSLNGAFVPLFGAAGLIMPALARVVTFVPFLPDVLAWRGEDRQAVQRLLASTGSNLDAQGVAFYQRHFATRQHVAAALGMMAQWDLPGLWQALPRLPARLTLVATTGDLTIPSTQAYEVQSRVGGATRVHLHRGLGHLAHEEDAALMVRVVSPMI